MKIKVYTGRIEDGVVITEGRWKNGEYLREKDALNYELMGKAYYYFSRENVFRLDKFEKFKRFSEDKGYTVDEIMKTSGDSCLVISNSPINEGWINEHEYLENITDNGFGIFYGYLNKNKYQ